MNPVTINACNDIETLVNMYKRIQDIQSWPERSESELQAMEIPEGKMAVHVQCRYKGNPSLIRVVRTREGNAINVDFTYSVFSGIIRHIKNRIGTLYLENQNG